MSLARIKVGPRIIAAFAVLLVLMFVVTSVIITRLSSVRANSDATVRQRIESINQAELLAANSHGALQTSAMMLLATNKADIKALEAGLRNNSSVASATIAALSHLASDAGQERLLIAAVSQQRAPYVAKRAVFEKLVDQGKTAEASAYLNSDLIPAYDSFAASIDRLVQYQKSMANSAAASDAQAYESGRMLIISISVVALVLGVLLAFLITRSITLPLTRAVRVTKALSEGDLSVAIDVTSNDEVGQVLAAIDEVVRSVNGISEEVVRLAEAAALGDFSARGNVAKYQNTFATITLRLNALMETTESGLNEISRVVGAMAEGDLTQKMTGEFQGSFAVLRDSSNHLTEGLTQFVVQIREVVEQISTAAGQIAIGNNDLSQRTEEQASSLEETASSMEELTSTVKQNAENAQHANQLSIGARDIATKGGAVVTQVVTTMAEMNLSSKKIADIIGVIDGIAFQTNILALNAAVEAARAGEQGRGFAVVAGEVRNLAQRSAGAAKEIKELIGDSVTKTEAGSKLVDEAGRTMDEIVTAVKRVTDIVSEITAASLEQGEGIEQVNQAIAQMDQVTQQNAALVEESTAAAAALEDQAQSLVQSVAIFKLSNEIRAIHAARESTAHRAV